MSSRGKKDCPNCNTEIGARCLLCDSCGYHFPSKEVRKDLLEEKNKPKTKEIKIFTESGIGRKTCSECSVIVAGVTKICPKCNYDFSILQKEKALKKEEIKRKKEEIRNEKELKKQEIRNKKALKREKKEEKKESLVGFNILQKELKEAGIQQGVMESIEYVEPVKLSPKDHAKRILNYGKEKASILLKLHKWENRWSHVDWDIVEKGLV